jgi:hypothetical protein
MTVDEGTKVEVIFQRAAKWFGIDPGFIELTDRLFPGDVKRRLSLELIILNDMNKINYVKLTICDNQINNVK